MSWIAPSPSSAPPGTLGLSSAGALIEQAALAPAPGGVLRSFSPVRIAWVQQEERFASARATETAIHRAIREVERLLKDGEHRQAMILSEVLAFDLAITRWGGPIERLMDQWNQRFPSDIRSVIETDLDGLGAAFNQLLGAADYRRAQSKLDGYFLERIWRARFEDPASPAFIRGYESHADMREDRALALDLETTFKVRFPSSARKWFRQGSPLSVTVSGLRAVGWIMTTIEDRHPWLKGAFGSMAKSRGTREPS